MMVMVGYGRSAVTARDLTFINSGASWTWRLRWPELGSTGSDRSMIVRCVLNGEY